MQMDDRTIHMIVEPNYITPFWYARSIEGLEEAAALYFPKAHHYLASGNSHLTAVMSPFPLHDSCFSTL